MTDLLGPSPLGAGNLLSIVILSMKHVSAWIRWLAPADLSLDRASRHRFLEPIHNVKDGSQAAIPWLGATDLMILILEKMSLGDGGAYRDRTDDLMLAKQPLSQLS